MDWQPEKNLPEAFHHVALKVYQNDSLWLPETYAELANSFGTKNPYFSNAKAWLDYVPEQTRLAGFFNPELKIEGRAVAFFGYWETLDQLEPNQTLFLRFEQWAKANGAEMVYGPVNFSTHRLYRVRLNYFEHGCYPGESYNPSYYPALLEKLGYSLDQQYYSLYSISDLPRIIDFMSQYEGAPKIFQRKGLRIQPITPDYWYQNRQKFAQSIHKMFKQNFAYTEMPYEEFDRAVIEPFGRRLCPYVSTMALDAEDNIAGIYIVFPDYAPLMRQGAQNPVAAADINYEQHFPLLESPTGIAKVVASHPAYRRYGVTTMLVMEAVKQAVARGYIRLVAGMMRKEARISQMRGFGDPQFSDYEHLYGLFAKPLN